MNKDDSRIIPDIFVKASIAIGARTFKALPDAAVVSYGGKTYVFTAEADNRFVPVEATAGLHRNGFTEVRLPEGINPDAKFLTKGSYTLLGVMFNAEEE